MSAPAIALCSDFGTADGYVGAMKGVLSSCCPGVPLVDLTHDLPPGDVIAGAYVLAQSVPHFPRGTVVLAVVDPGVGTPRRAVALCADGRFLVGPDNGLFASLVASSEGVVGVVLDQPAFWRSPVSDVFHGRDVFAPVAGALAAGVALGQVGTRLDPGSLAPNPEPAPDRRGGAEVGAVVYVDRFGNLVTNIALPDGVRGRAECAGRVLVLCRTYADAPQDEWLCLRNSAGRLEIARNGTSAAADVGAARGLVVSWRAGDAR